MSDNKRVNKITAQFKDGVAVLTMYKTNDKLGTLNNTDLGIPNYEEVEGGKNKQAYLEHCKDALKSALLNGGVTGFYFDDTSYKADNGVPSKMDKATFEGVAKEQVSKVITDAVEGIIVDTKVKDAAIVAEAYKDGYIKNASVTVLAEFTLDGTVSVSGEVDVMIKSGQFCKPKTIILADGRTLNIGQKNIKGLFVVEEPVAEEKPKKAKKTKAKAEEVTTEPIVESASDIA